MSNPYYERRMERRKNLIEVFELAKANGCECYFTPEESGYDYGFMIYPDGTIMYGQNGDFFGWKFSIQYKPSRETGSGCSCKNLLLKSTGRRLFRLRILVLVLHTDSALICIHPATNGNGATGTLTNLLNCEIVGKLK